MGGNSGSNETLRQDPAIDRWAAMRDNLHLYWRPRPGNMFRLFIYLVAIPVGLYYGIQKGFVQIHVESIPLIDRI